MKTWVNNLLMILIGGGLWLLYNYFYYGTLEPVGLNFVLALVFGVCMWGIGLFFYRKNKKK